MPDVKIAVGFRREPGDYGVITVFFVLDVLFYYLMNEVYRFSHLIKLLFLKFDYMSLLVEDLGAFLLTDLVLTVLAS